VADTFYEHGVKNFALGNVVWKLSGGSAIRAILVDLADYAFSQAHDFMDDVAAGAQEETSGNMTLVDAAANGVLDASDVTFVGTTGDTCEAVIVKRHITNDADSLPLIFWDTGAGLPVTLGGDVTVQWGNVAGTLLARI